MTLLCWRAHLRSKQRHRRGGGDDAELRRHRFERRLLKVTEVMIWANALLQIAFVRTARQGARQLFEDSPSFLATRTCAVSNGTGAEAAVVPSFANIGSDDGYSR